MDGTVAGYAVTVIPTRAGAFIGEVAEAAGVVVAAEGVAVVADSRPSSKIRRGPIRRALFLLRRAARSKSPRALSLRP
jgi:hypothetical protein